jgi:N-methylhydantoinase B
MTVHTEDGETFTPPAYGIRHIGPSRFAMASPGGGGWGDPLRRDVNAVLRDVHDGVVDRATASDIYGVQLTEDGKGVDLEATDRRRVELAPVA